MRLLLTLPMDADQLLRDLTGDRSIFSFTTWGC